MAAEPNNAPNREKLIEMMLLIAQSHQDDRAFGKTRLCKELFWADALHYAMTGSSISGVTYTKMPNGPAPKDALRAYDDLVNQGEAEERVVGTPKGSRKQLVALREPRREIFSESEIAQIEWVTQWLRDATAADVSQHSHEVGPWKYAVDDQPIDLRMVFLSDDQPNQEQLREAQHELAKRGFATSNPD